MSKETTRQKSPAGAKRKLTRAEKKEIAAIIQRAKGDGKPHTAQQTIPYVQMYPDGICKVSEKKYSKSIVFEDINYQLAQADDKTAIFENWCDFLNYFDASVSVQLSFINQGARKEKAQEAIQIPQQDDAFNSIRAEYADMLKNQLEKGNNGLEKAKYITFSVEADNLTAAKARLSRIETDVLNNFKVLGVSAHPMTGYERLQTLHGIFHPEGEPFRFSFDWLAPSGLSTKDFIAPSSFRFGEGRMFRMGKKLGAVSFLEILAPSPYTVKKEIEKIDPLTQKPVIGKDGKPVTEEKEITIPAFKVVSVFDVSQTEGKELPNIAVDTLTGNVELYEDFFKALKETSPVPIAFEKIEGGAHGYYHLEDKRIAIDEGMSELQTIKTAIHEIAHAKLHDIDLTSPMDGQNRVDRRTREVEAESVAYTVCQHYGLDTSDYSFGYVAGWSSGRELAELKSSLETIRSAAAEIINSIDGKLAEIQKAQDKEQAPKEQTAEPDRDTYSIYQLKRDEATQDLRFEPYDRLIATGHEVDRANYDLVYTAPLTEDMTLNTIWEKFNIDHPKDFKGHSLSVSDIVVLHQNGGDTAHYVDSIGYQQVPEFLKKHTPLIPDEHLTGEKIRTPRGSFSLTDMTAEQMKEAGYGLHHTSDDGKYHIMGNGTRAFAIAAEPPEKTNPLKHIEDTVEQNDNNFDGIINNTPQTPTVGELEQKVKAGEPISLVDLANAMKAEKAQGKEKSKTPARREEKPSIREQLKKAKETAAPKKAAKQKNHDLEV